MYSCIHTHTLYMYIDHSQCTKLYDIRMFVFLLAYYVSVQYMYIVCKVSTSRDKCFSDSFNLLRTVTDSTIHVYQYSIYCTCSCIHMYSLSLSLPLSPSFSVVVATAAHLLRLTGLRLSSYHTSRPLSLRSVIVDD